MGFWRKNSIAEANTGSFIGEALTDIGDLAAGELPVRPMGESVKA
jgi:hypothetical protein